MLQKNCSLDAQKRQKDGRSARLFAKAAAGIAETVKKSAPWLQSGGAAPSGARAGARVADASACGGSVGAAENEPRQEEPHAPRRDSAGDHDCGHDHHGQHSEQRDQRERDPEHKWGVPAAIHRAREIRDQRVELAVGAGRERGSEPVLELVGLQPSLSGRLAQALSDPLPVGV